MKYFFFSLTGFSLILLCHTLFAPFGFWLLAILYSLCLYLLFFLQDISSGYYFLGGITLGSELLGTSHFGLATILTWTIIIISLIFRHYLHLTSRYLRYCVALFLTLLLYNLILFPISSFFQRLFFLLALLPFLFILSYFTSSLKQLPDYESV